MKFCVLVLSLWILSACSSPIEEPSLTYDDFEHLSSWQEVKHHDGLWLIYFYHPLCPACEAIKDDIFQFAQSDTVPIYFLLAEGDFGRVPDEDIRGIPTIVVMDGENYLHFVSGTTSILSVLENLKSE